MHPTSEFEETLAIVRSMRAEVRHLTERAKQQNATIRLSTRVMDLDSIPAVTVPPSASGMKFSEYGPFEKTSALEG